MPSGKWSRKARTPVYATARASDAPGHTCGPNPNARCCSELGRSTRNSSGSSKTRSSRLADAKPVITRVPACTGQPAISTSCTQPRAMNRIGGDRRRLSSVARCSASSPARIACSTSGFDQDLVQQVADELTRGGEAAGDQVAHERADLAAGELLAVVGDLQQAGRARRRARCRPRSARRAPRCARRCSRRTRGTRPRSPRRVRCGSSPGTCSPSGPSPRSASWSASAGIEADHAHRDAVRQRHRELPARGRPVRRSSRRAARRRSRA